MSLYEMTGEAMVPLESTTFENEGITERQDLQRLLASQIYVIDSDLLVLCDEFSYWEGTQRRIDLLCVDREARLVVVELKRGQSGGHMELQALRYAAMISTMTFQEALESHARYLGIDQSDAEDQLRDHIQREDPEEDFGSDVRIILASADFSSELIASVDWLNKRELDIRCVRLKPFKLADRLVIQSEQVLPLRDAGVYEFRVRVKDSERRASLPKSGWTGAWFLNVGEHKSPCRSWDDSQRYGYISAGGGKSWQDQIRKPRKGELVFAYINSIGYVGVGTVSGPAVKCAEFIPHGQSEHLTRLKLQRPPTTPAQVSDERTCEYCLPIEWKATRSREDAVKEDHRRGTVVKIHDEALVLRLCETFGIDWKER